MIRRHRPPRAAATLAVAAAMAVAPGATAWSAPTLPAPSTAATADGGAPAPVIVILGDQLPGTPADAAHLNTRRQQAVSAQAPLLAAVKAAGGTDVKSFVVGNAFSATVSPALRARLAANPAVASVVPDLPVTVTPTAPAAPKTPTAPAATGRTGLPKVLSAPVPSAPAAAAADSGPYGGAICPSDPSQPLLEPEALYLTHTASTSDAPGADRIATGKGVKVAYIADGLDPDHPDFIRPDGSHAIVDHQDFSGEGWDAPSGALEAFGDASAMVAQGRGSYDLSKFVNPAHPLPAGCTIRIQGVSPDASLVALKAAGAGSFSNSAILQAIDYAVSVAHVDVLNESFGSSVTPDSGAHDTISLFNAQAAAAGVTVTVASGDSGANGTIATPAAGPGVITVGASTDDQSYQQTGFAAAPFSNGTWANNRISSISSGGFTQGGRTVDLVAPGETDWALCSTDTDKYAGCFDYKGEASPIQAFSGTSQSAPLTAGAAADVIQAYREGHHGASPAPALVKALLTGTATDLGLPAHEQGAGLLNVRAAVEAARGYQAPARIGSTVVVTSGQVDITGAPGSTHTADVTVANTGTGPQTVRAATRTFVPVSEERQTVPLNSATDPAFTYATTGATWVHHDVTITVPPGVDRLATSIAWAGGVYSPGKVTPVVRMTLLDPAGRLENATRPQGGRLSPNYGAVDVPHPVAGQWKAILYTPAGDRGLTGPVQLATSFERAVAAGTVTPQATTLAPGQTKTLHVRLTTPTTSGDSSESVTVTDSNGRTTSVPVILRTLVPVSGSTGSFTGTVTGGNGRPGAPAQSFTYAFDVPKGRKDLRVGLTLGQDQKVLLQGVLISPNGTPVDVESNALLDAKNTFTGTAAGLSTTAITPAAGRWRFVVLVVNPVTGAEPSQTFNGTIGLDQDLAAAPGLPNSGTAKLPAGQATTVTVTYTNNTAAAQQVQADGRLTGRVDLPLVPQGGSGAVALPLTPDTQAPGFLIPPGTDRLTAVAASSTPAQLEITGPTGSPDLFGNLKQAQKGSTTSTAQSTGSAAQPVVPGFWTTYLAQIGPFPTTGAPAGTSTITATAHTLAFDPALTSNTGDPYAAAFNATAPATTPVTVQPGATGSLQITITPTAAKGTTVSGTLYLVTAPATASTGSSLISTTGSVLAAIPYRYNIT
ncbi:peptidase [Kitasatospora sp. MMS16-BH015]|uniref:S8 family serine peptidase n=1 Tax=Kitasatospora sp. MMS16-BH015 TaxID=2018025 RepID=UPI000CA2C2B3|nr:S8 family serine peptidase [Kitasatospora sp. MMS16-BH015]AUG77880.1 peptidase [Kitasatospora sp. MMS16-BH015]